MRRLVFTLLLTGCPSPAPLDAGADAGAGVDGGVDAPTPDGGSDAGPCGVCEGARPLCDTVSMVCVACLSDTDCTVAGLGVCLDGSCVACDTNDDCPLSMPQCSATNTCEACTGDSGCMGRSEGEVCDGGTCVECLTNTDCGAMEGCVRDTNMCRSYTVGGASLCGDCVADAECASGQLCIPMVYDDPATAAADPVAVGNHCLWRSDASGPGAPSGACSTVRPYVSTQSLTSVDGVTADVCTFRVSTCEAQRDFSMVNCMTLDAAGNALCGVASVPDGVCRRLDAASNRCTTYCLSDDDCPSGSTCDTGTTPRQCRL